MPETTQQHPAGFMRRWGWPLVGLAVLAAFLVGFIPEYLRANRLKDRLSTGQQTQRDLLHRQQLSNLRGQIDRVFIESTRHNYGVASGVASSFFSDVRSVLNETSDANLKASLQNVAAQRDSVIGGLAKADPGVVTDVGKIVDEMDRQAPLNTAGSQ